ncbi:hypothetical protein [Pseudotenacibaculum sp. MALMAid0570]
MKRIMQIIKIIQLFLILPFQIANGSKKKAYLRIKKMLVAANLL